MSEAVFELRDIVKAFPGVVALDRVSFTCRPGEVHCLVGENGAGKSTLIKILAGAYQADSGSLHVGGQERSFSHPVEALQAGISVIYQEFSLLPDKTVAENIFLGREHTRWGLLDRKRMNEQTRRVLDIFGNTHRIDPDRLAGTLAVAEQQMVEIAKAIAVDASVVVMDEPTAALNEHECETLFQLVDKLREQGRAVVYITHRMREITRLADRVSVLKDGKTVAAYDSVPEPGAIIHAMVGREIEEFYPPPAQPEDIGAVRVAVANGSNSSLSDISLELRAGEIAGFAGLQGAGRSALAMALFGEEPFDEGSVELDGDPVRFTQPRDAISAGIAMLPGDRKSEALLLMQSVIDNGMITARAFSGMLGPQDRTQHADTGRMSELFAQVDVRAASLEAEIQSLSGGNQQKAIVARWLALGPKVLIFVEPTRGIDVNAKSGIYRLMRELAHAGAAVMMISSDLPEVLGASDRIIVMRAGTIVAQFDRGASEAQVMHAAVGEDDLADAAA